MSLRDVTTGHAIIYIHFESGLLPAELLICNTVWAAERQSYEELFTYIQNELLWNPEVLPMIDTASWLIIYVSVKSIT